MTITIENSKLDIDAVYRSGQTFGIIKDGNRYTVLSLDKVCVIERGENTSSLYIAEDDYPYWKQFFNLDIPFPEYVSLMQKDDNEFIRKCADYSKGLILLKQDLWETIMSFIISQRKSIPAITKSLNSLRETFGVQQMVLLDGIGEISFRSLPRPDDLLWCGNLEDTLTDMKKGESENAKKYASCGLGYRDEYLLYAADWFLRMGEAGVEELYNGDYACHMKKLMEVRGIGEKVANCISLFALGDYDSFPVDVWIQRILDKGLLPDDLSRYDGFKGFLQQVIFFYTINHKNEFI